MQPAAPAPEVADVPVAKPATEDKPCTIKYMALLNDATDERFDELSLMVWWQFGRRVDKSVPVRILIPLAADDANQRDQVIREVDATKAKPVKKSDDRAFSANVVCLRQ